MSGRKAHLAAENSHLKSEITRLQDALKELNGGNSNQSTIQQLQQSFKERGSHLFYGESSENFAPASEMPSEIDNIKEDLKALNQAESKENYFELDTFRHEDEPKQFGEKRVIKETFESYYISDDDVAENSKSNDLSFSNCETMPAFVAKPEEPDNSVILGELARLKKENDKLRSRLSNPQESRRVRKKKTKPTFSKRQASLMKISKSRTDITPRRNERTPRQCFLRKDKTPRREKTPRQSFLGHKSRRDKSPSQTKSCVNLIINTNRLEKSPLNRSQKSVTPKGSRTVYPYNPNQDLTPSRKRHCHICSVLLSKGYSTAYCNVHGVNKVI